MRRFFGHIGRIIADGLTKASRKSLRPNLYLLYYVLEYGTRRITSCTESWRKEVAMTKVGTLHGLQVMDPSRCNLEEDVACDTQSEARLRHTALADE